jgi:hypothetical protein
MSSSSIAIQLLLIAPKYLFYSATIAFIGGSIGHMLNILVLANVKLFRGNRCTFYLIAESITSICIWIPFVIFYDIVPPYGCIIFNQDLTRYYSYVYYPVVNGLIPVLISSLFGILAYRNVRHLVRRQIPVQRRRLDRQLTEMILAHGLTFVIFFSAVHDLSNTHA